MGISIELQPGIKVGAQKKNDGFVFIESHKEKLGNRSIPYQVGDRIIFPHGSQAHLYLTNSNGDQIDFMVYDFRKKHLRDRKPPETKLIGLLETTVEINSKQEPKSLVLDSQKRSWKPDNDTNAKKNSNRFIKSITWIPEAS